MGLFCWPPAGLRLNGGGSMPEVINSIIKVPGARCLARPWGRNEDCRAGLVGSVPRAGWHGLRASLGCCAQRFSTIFTSLVILQQLLRDPTRPHPHLAPSPSLPVPQASQGRSRR